jgi:hypothetical protein
LHKRESISEAELSSALAALGCERYRLKHGVWPAELKDVVEAKLLNAIPADPIDNLPLRYRKTRDGIVVYSIGPNAVDDGGAIANGDVGFRLWNAQSRGQPAIAAPEVK